MIQRLSLEKLGELFQAIDNQPAGKLSELARIAGLNLSEDYIGADLSDEDLSEDNLAGANLSNANLSNANLSNTNLNSANLYKTNLCSAVLKNADLSYADLSYADLSYADLSDTDLSCADLTNANLSNANLFRANLDNANLNNANLSYVNFGCANLLNAKNLTTANLSHAILTTATLGLSQKESLMLKQQGTIVADAADSFSNVQNSVIQGNHNRIIQGSQGPKQVTNNDLANSQFGSGLINAGTVNAGQIGGNVYNIHLGQQQNISDNSSSSPQRRERSQQKRDSLEKAYVLQSQKVANIRRAWVIETDPSRKFQYEQQLQAEERSLQELADKLDAMEQYLERFKKSETETDNSVFVPVEDNVISQPIKVKLKTSDGSESASLRAAAHWITGVKQDKTVTFILPSGYVRHSFSQSVNRDGMSSGGYVRWESDNPHDARIRLHAWADAPNGISNVSVTEVWGIREDAV